MNTNDKGNIGLIKVMSKLFEMGYFCFLPFSDTTCVDLIIANSKMELKKVQIKYRAINKNGTIEVPFETVVNGKKIPIDKSKIDMYIVFCSTNSKIYFIDVDKNDKRRSINLRVIDSKQKIGTIILASNYEEINFKL